MKNIFYKAIFAASVLAVPLKATDINNNNNYLELPRTQTPNAQPCEVSDTELPPLPRGIFIRILRLAATQSITKPWQVTDIEKFAQSDKEFVKHFGKNPRFEFICPGNQSQGFITSWRCPELLNCGASKPSHLNGTKLSLIYTHFDANIDNRDLSESCPGIKNLSGINLNGNQMMSMFPRKKVLVLKEGPEQILIRLFSKFRETLRRGLHKPAERPVIDNINIDSRLVCKDWRIMIDGDPTCTTIRSKLVQHLFEEYQALQKFPALYQPHYLKLQFGFDPMVYGAHSDFTPYLNQCHSMADRLRWLYNNYHTAGKFEEHRVTELPKDFNHEDYLDRHLLWNLVLPDGSNKAEIAIWHYVNTRRNND